MHDDEGQEPRKERWLPEIVYGEAGTIVMHPVRDDELEKLGRVPDPTCLSLGFAFFSMSFAASIALLTATMSDRAFFVFAAVAVVTGVVGIALTCLGAKMWVTARRARTRLLQEIRARVPPKGIQEDDSAR